jgi:hypothetical protein
MSDKKHLAIVIFNKATKQFEKNLIDVKQLSTQYTCTLATSYGDIAVHTWCLFQSIVQKLISLQKKEELQHKVT